MKAKNLFLLFAATGMTASHRCYAQNTGNTVENLPPPPPYRVTANGANHRVWQRNIFERAPDGRIVSRPHQVTELATGLNYRNAQGQMFQSQEVIEEYATGAIARQGPIQVIFANSLNTYGSIDMQTPDGKRLRSNVLGLAYFDRATGRAVLIAQIQDSFGQLASDNVAVYANAFNGVKADVRYTYRRGSFEQDVVLREQPPRPESFGLNSATTDLEVMTEFINPPAATITDTTDASGTAQDQAVTCRSRIFWRKRVVVSWCQKTNYHRDGGE